MMGFPIEIQKVVTIGSVDTENGPGSRRKPSLTILEAVFGVIGRDYDDAGGKGNAEYRFPGPQGPLSVHVEDPNTFSDTPPVAIS